MQSGSGTELQITLESCFKATIRLKKEIECEVHEKAKLREILMFLTKYVTWKDLMESGCSAECQVTPRYLLEGKYTNENV